jgi:hypothetical protein
MAEEQQVIVRFVSEVEAYAISDEPLELPSKLTRYGLSELVNHLLASTGSVEGGKPIPFDFLLDGELLRTSLKKFMQLRGISGVRAAARRSTSLCIPAPRLWGPRRASRGRALMRRARPPLRSPPSSLLPRTVAAGSDARAALLPARQGARARGGGSPRRLGLRRGQPTQ